MVNGAQEKLFDIMHDEDVHMAFCVRYQALLDSFATHDFLLGLQKLANN